MRIVGSSNSAEVSATSSPRMHCQKIWLRHLFPYVRSSSCALLYIRLWYVGLWGDPLKDRSREEQMEEEKKKGRCKRIRRDEGKGSWYLNHVGRLFCIAQVYLKPSSICSVPLCFQALWGNAHTQSPAHTVTCTVSPSAVFMIALHCHDSGFTLWWNHQMWTEQPAEELWYFTG